MLGYEIEKEKACTRCSVIKPLKDFGVRTKSFDGRTSQCRACTNAASKLRMRKKKSREVVALQVFGDPEWLRRPIV